MANEGTQEAGTLTPDQDLALWMQAMPRRHAVVVEITNGTRRVFAEPGGTREGAALVRDRARIA